MSITVNINDYKEIKLIREGSLSKVFLVERKNTKELFAAIFYKFNLEKISKKESINLTYELENIFKITHSSFVKFEGINYTDDETFLVTEYFQNQTLSKCISMINDTNKLINIYGIASGLSYLHKQDILFKNLNPDQIYENNQFHPKLFYFDLSKFHINDNSGTTDHSSIYTAPEIVNGQKYSKSSDVYSFGLIAYFLMTQEEANEGETIEELIDKMKTKKIASRYEELIISCLSKESEERPSFDKIVYDLENDDKFITENINKNEYEEYINKIEDEFTKNEEKEYDFDFDDDDKEESYNDDPKKPLYIDVQNIDLNKFMLLKEIGKGGFGSLYLIKNKETGILYAAKIFRKMNYKNDQSVQSLINEVTIHAQIDHPCIVKFAGYSPTNFSGKLYPVIATEYMRNGDLDYLLQKERKGFPVNDFWNDTARLIVIYGVALGMSYLHSLKIIHRDLKPSQILLDDQLFPKLSSFGLSKFIDESNPDSNTIGVGTLLFMSPEILNESNYGLSTDVYSFAMVVYMIIVNNEFIPGYLSKVVNEKYRPEIPDDVPQCYRKLIESCWSHDPNDRPSFNEIVELLRNDKSFITENVDEDKYRSYIRYVDESVKKETEINKETFGTYSLKLIEASKKKGIINLQDFEMINKVEEDEETEIYSVTNKNTKETCLAFISKNDYNFTNTSEEEKEICKEVKKNIKMRFSTIQRLIGYSFYDFKYQSKPLIICQYNAKITLNDIIERYKKVEYKDGIENTKKLKLLLGISSGILYLHIHGIYISYLNPKNIYIDDTLNPTICYFDFNKFKINHKNRSSIYTAPEIVNGQKYSKSSDVYSFGLIAYFLMTQEEANEGETIEELIDKMKMKKIASRYEELIISCLSKESEERPSFDKIVYDLENDDKFITKGINKDEYEEYINKIEDEFINAYINDGEEEEEEEEEKNEMMGKLESLNIQYIDLKNYEKVCRIARGGCSKVYKIKDKATGEFYAAKKLFSDDINDLIQELSVFTDIDHASIIKLIGYSLRSFKNKRRNIIIIEYVKNGSLERLLEKERLGCEFKFWTDTMKLINIYGLASVMSYLHSKGILHLDIKPNNNLLNEYLFPKLIDFGLSKKLMSSEIMKQSISELKCTLSFAAPEIFQDHEYTEAADVYAFAVEVYEIMNKEYPFKGLNIQQIINEVVNNKGRPKFTNEIPKVYKELIESCWCQEAKDRLKFHQIVDKLRNDKSFITTKVDEKLYRAYIDYIDGKIREKSQLDEIFKKYSVQREYKKQERKRILPFGEGFISLNKFKVLNPVRQGIISNVYQVINIETQVEYLASISNFEIDDFSNQRTSRILNEVKELLKLKMPTIQRFIGFSFYDFQHSPNPVSISELLPNKTLYEILEEERHGKIQLKATDKLIILYGICYGMFYLHSHKISHPTLSTTNVYIDEKNHPILSEIGKYTLPQSSQTVSNLTSTGITRIDLLCAPEIIEQKEDTLKSDVYSYSFIVYEVMTGDIPFDDEDIKNHTKLISEIIVKNHRPKIKKQITNNYKELIELCWEGNSELRPSFEEIIKKLESDEFITSDINEEEYRKYVDSIKHNQK